MRRCEDAKMRRCEDAKTGFTLAEVLITLGIIGVVAALTIPNLIAKHQDQVRVTALKKFYSVTSQAIAPAGVDNPALCVMGKPSQYCTAYVLEKGTTNY